jgi:hypothetical protein
MTNASTPPPVERIPFGPVLVGQTEKTLQALLRHTLAGSGLSEPEWVTLRLATMIDEQLDRPGLISVVADRAKFADPTAIVDALTERGLVVDGQPTTAGRELVSDVLAASETSNGTVWRDLPTGDVDATTRVLNEVLRRARELAASLGPSESRSRHSAGTAPPEEGDQATLAK